VLRVAACGLRLAACGLLVQFVFLLRCCWSCTTYTNEKSEHEQDLKKVNSVIGGAHLSKRPWFSYGSYTIVEVSFFNFET
jgi:hypothetical protein